MNMLWVSMHCNVDNGVHDINVDNVNDDIDVDGSGMHWERVHEKLQTECL